MVIGTRGSKADYAKLFCEFLIDHMRIRNSRYNLGIAPLKEKKRENAGLVLHDENGIVLFVDMRRPFNEFAYSVAHEMVHVRQIARGLLKQSGGDDPAMWWRGQKYEEHEMPPYLERPWELQALREQDILVRKFEQYLCEKYQKTPAKRKRANSAAK